LIDGITTDIYDDEIELRIDYVDCCDRSTFARDDGADLRDGLELRFPFDPYRDRISGGSIHRLRDSLTPRHRVDRQRHQDPGRCNHAH